MLVSAGKGAAFQRRKSNGSTSLSTAGSASTAPRWVKLTRSGSTITAYESSNGSTWTKVGSDTFSMSSTVLIGLAVSSHVYGVACTANFDGVAVSLGSSTSASLPSGWNHRDIGAVTAAGNATYNSPTFTVTARGADIWGTSDAFHYAFRSLTGDGSLVARVASVQNTDAWTKAGVMIRETLTAAAKQAYVLVSAGKGVAFQRRRATGGTSIHTAGTFSKAARWLKLTRQGQLFSAYESADGKSWSMIGSDTISMATSVFVGLAVTSHDTAASATAKFDGVVGS
jgi:regulation of enolase protein 1 (concanavalin A-like superfamily)